MLRQVDKVNGFVIQKITSVVGGPRWQLVRGKVGDYRNVSEPFFTMRSARECAKTGNLNREPVAQAA